MWVAMKREAHGFSRAEQVTEVNTGNSRRSVPAVKEMKVAANPLVHFGNTFQDVFAHLGVGTDKIRKLTQFIGINIGSGYMHQVPDHPIHSSLSIGLHGSILDLFQLMFG
jgi:hypothetical protein